MLPRLCLQARHGQDEGEAARKRQPEPKRSTKQCKNGHGTGAGGGASKHERTSKQAKQARRTGGGMVGSRSGRVRKSLELKTGWDASRIMDHGWAPPLPACTCTCTLSLPSALPCLVGPAAARAPACLPRYSMSGIYSAAPHVCLHPGGRHWQAPAADCAEAAVAVARAASVLSWCVCAQACTDSMQADCMLKIPAGELAHYTMRRQSVSSIQ